MKKAKVSELKSDLSGYLSYVRKGGVVRVFDRDRPIAEIVPPGRTASSGAAEFDAVLDDLERKGIVHRGIGDLPADFLTRRAPRSERALSKRFSRNGKKVDEILGQVRL